jgi:AmiR/NasT family two-component response regulator
MEDAEEAIEKALTDNRAVNTAIGMLIVLHSVDQAGAYSLLREHAAPTGRRIAEVAARFVETHDLNPPERG